MSSTQVETIELEQQQHHPEAFPLALCNLDSKLEEAEVLSWIGLNREWLLDQLAIHGAIVFRDFPVNDADDFDKFITAFKLRNFPYAESLSNAVRRNRTERVFTANEAPPSVAIYLHHEMAQTPVYPAKLFFFCQQAPSENGQTPLCRSDVLMQRLQLEAAGFLARCEKLGVKYRNTMPLQEDLESGQGRSWHSTLACDDKGSAEAKLASLRYDWQWLQDGSLSVTTPVLPAIRSLDDGRQVFFNQLIAAFRGWKDKRNDPQKSISFGDGSEIPASDMETVITLSDELTYDHCWKKGDVALVDNLLVMHGRRPYSGMRTVLASLTQE